MNKQYTYKKQGDGRDSWRCDVFDGGENVGSYMVYENPDIIRKKEIEQIAEEKFDKALQENWYSRFDVYYYAEKGEPKAVSLLNYYDHVWSVIEQNFLENNFIFEVPDYSEELS